jgi:Bacterial protein of unknown function (DUF924)
VDEARSVRDFWFGQLPPSPQELNRRLRFWFGADDSQMRRQRDAAIRARFAGLLERAAAGELAAWADGPRRRLSLIILLDQFPRNIFRGSVRAFAYDEKALALSLSGMQSAADAALCSTVRCARPRTIAPSSRNSAASRTATSCWNAPARRRRSSGCAKAARLSLSNRRPGTPDRECAARARAAPR